MKKTQFFFLSYHPFNLSIKLPVSTLIIILIFLYWAFIYPNHILFTEQLSLFLYRSHYWTQYALQPGGWAAYCGSFLAQFFINQWAGALIQTFLVVALLKLSKRILNKTGATGRIGWIGIIPVMLLTALQCDNHFTPGDSLALICPFALTLLYLNIPQVWMRRLVYSLAIVPVYLFSGFAATISLYTACMIYELLCTNDRWKYATPIWMIAVIFLPFGWQSIYLMPYDGLFDILSFPLEKAVKYTPHLLLSFTPLCILTFCFFTRKRWKIRITGKIITLFPLFVLVGCGHYLFSKTYNRVEEQKFGMNIASSQNNWDKILKISERVKNPDQHTAYYTNLALSMKGELPQKMFRYSQTNENGLILTRELDDFNLRYGSDFYYHIGILNEAIRWIFDANIFRSKGMDYHTLIRLAVWNKENGYEPVAEKYFDILEGTLMYCSFAKLQRKSPMKQQEKSTFDSIEFYIGGRETIYNMAQHYENHPHNPMILDYLLCYMLLKNDVEQFLNLFDMCYQQSSEQLPQAYQEALLSIAGMGKINIQDYTIDNINQLNFKKFSTLSDKQNHAAMKKQFGDTWWYYSYKK